MTMLHQGCRRRNSSRGVSPGAVLICSAHLGEFGRAQLLRPSVEDVVPDAHLSWLIVAPVRLITDQIRSVRMVPSKPDILGPVDTYRALSAEADFFTRQGAFAQVVRRTIKRAQRRRNRPISANRLRVLSVHGP